MISYAQLFICLIACVCALAYVCVSVHVCSHLGSTCNYVQAETCLDR